MPLNDLYVPETFELWSIVPTILGIVLYDISKKGFNITVTLTKVVRHVLSQLEKR